MRTALLIVLALGLVAIALPAVVAPTAAAHSYTCYWGSSCTVKCLTHFTPGHECRFYWG
jgi:hypothetical protein